MVTFAQPLWLLAGLAGVVALAFLFRFLARRRLAALENFVAHQLIGRLTDNISTKKRRLKDLLLLLAVLLAFVAMARPQYGEHWVDVKRKGIDLLFALDTSKSMLAEDVKPNRLKRAHLAILDFVRRLDGDRVGLLPFAGTSYLMCPLTLDYDAFEQSLAAVDTDLIPQGGTNIAGVIDRAVEVLDNAASHKILIIVTDGENLEGDAVDAAAKAAAKGLTIYTVGVGTAKGELIPLDSNGTKGFVKDESGNFVTSRLDEKTLTAIAEKSGGLYAPLGTGEGLESIYRQKLALVPKEELAERRRKVPIERFEWPLALAALVLAVELLVGERKKTRPLALGDFFRRLLKKKAPALLLLLMLLPFGSTRSYGADGEEAYRRGDYLAASQYYEKRLEKDPNNARLQYNYGTAAFKNHLYDEAVAAFTKSLHSDDVELQEKAYYNRGNSYYKKGAEMRQADPQGTAEQWRQALASLQSALELNPADEDAKHNKEIVSEQLAQLQEELKQEKQAEGEKPQNDKQQGSKKENGREDRQTGKSQAQQPDENKAQPEGKSPQDEKSGAGSARPEDRQEKKAGGEGNRQDEAEKNANQSAAAMSGGKEGQETTPAEQSINDAERRQQGKMTREEAVRMLNSLKQEEGELNYVPSGRTMKQTNKDW